MYVSAIHSCANINEGALVSNACTNDWDYTWYRGGEPSGLLAPNPQPLGLASHTSTPTYPHTNTYTMLYKRPVEICESLRRHI